MEEELSNLAKDLLFTMVYYGEFKEDIIPYKYKKEYEEWIILQED